MVLSVIKTKHKSQARLHFTKVQSTSVQMTLAQYDLTQEGSECLWIGVRLTESGKSVV
jgi:hypothetical protein